MGIRRKRSLVVLFSIIFIFCFSNFRVVKAEIENDIKKEYYKVTTVDESRTKEFEQESYKGIINKEDNYSNLINKSDKISKNTFLSVFNNRDKEKSTDKMNKSENINKLLQSFGLPSTGIEDSYIIITVVIAIIIVSSVMFKEKKDKA
ncbi:hypothetical protein [Clostridium septicum]|uniref:Uncharacterized protein n=1 Tax=Clostridium septicum TaxID=1504 RepID=A0A9N7PIQ7_CLOSE|nr:hypothetical protein [Clostridium septicum]AYE33915.1 hypothetical protein CP523_05205 [Clostridium septicum]MDU1312934.1 hypothetical protein [Clostridium septicum]QAS62066.1 hypothetical protein EI377_15765 [Clostridium septicum]UEC21477.1 hypothetical protein LK444_03625 [Clostridium septicum]USS00476.1 hypothetical protein NH397_13460 [Clostridium septicum]